MIGSGPRVVTLSKYLNFVNAFCTKSIAKGVLVRGTLRYLGGARPASYIVVPVTFAICRRHLAQDPGWAGNSSQLSQASSVRYFERCDKK